MTQTRSPALALLAFALAPALVLARRVTIDNTAPRLDDTGVSMDAHDCSIRVLPNGSYVMHAIEYGLCVAPTNYGCDQTADKCGFRGTHNVTIWTSPDLSSGSWHRVGYAFDLAARPAGLLFRPDAIYNPNTGLWVLWYNDASRGNIYVTAVSATPEGPFSDFRTSNTTSGSFAGGDFHLFLDEADGKTGYVIWTGMSSAPGLDHKIRINKLTEDFRDIVEPDSTYMFSETFNEAPMLFQIGPVYYALFGHCCCFCFQGSGLFVHTAPHPLGPWTLQSSPTSDVSCEAPPPPAAANPFCADKQEFNNVTVNLVCEEGVIDSITNAHFGTPAGACPNFEADDACDDSTFEAYAVATCVGKANCTLTSQGADPCLGVVKSIVAVAHCSAGPGGFSPDGPVAPPLTRPMQMRVAMSKSAAATYGAAAAAIATLGASPTPGQGCLYGGSTDVAVTHAQQSFIAKVRDGKGGLTFISIGDRWVQSPDGLKGHEPQYWAPLHFDATGNIAHVTWNDTVSFDIAVAGELE